MGKFIRRPRARVDLPDRPRSNFFKWFPGPHDLYPEIAHLPEWERVLIVDRSRERLRRSRRYQWTLVAALLGGAAAVGLIVLALSTTTSPLRGYAIAVAVFVVLMLGCWFEARLKRLAVKQELLRENILPAYCCRCGYRLPESTGVCCPACGEQLRTRPPAAK